MVLQGIFRHNDGPYAVRGSAVHGWPVGGVGTWGGGTLLLAYLLPPLVLLSLILSRFCPRSGGLGRVRIECVHSSRRIPLRSSCVPPVRLRPRYREGVFPPCSCLVFLSLFRRRPAGRSVARLPRIALTRPAVVPDAVAHAPSLPRRWLSRKSPDTPVSSLAPTNHLSSSLDFG